MSISGITGDLPSNGVKIAENKRENIRQTLEMVQSNSNSILQLSLQWKDIEDYFDNLIKSIVKREEEIELKMKQIEWKMKYFKKRGSDIEERERLCDGDEECLRWKFESVRRYKRRLRRRCERRELRLEGRELSVENREVEVGNREVEVEERGKKLSLVERRVLERLLEVEGRERRVEEKEREFRGGGQKEKGEIEDCGEREKGEIEEGEEGGGGGEGEDYADIRVNVVMNGRDLQRFLNGRVNDHEKLRDEVSRGIGLSADPAKLVLDAIEGFYDEGVEDGDGGLELGVVRKSCVLLLEQLVEVKPRIRDCVRERALRVAREWKGKMNVGDDGCYLEVVGFLQLVASYGLMAEFGKDELLSLFEGCAGYDRARELCRCLGFDDDVHDIIQNLILREQPFEAIRLINAFGMVDMFPPAPILKAHLEFTFHNAEELYRDECPSEQWQIKCINAKLAALVSVVSCIKEYGLQSICPVQSLEQLISELTRLKRKCNASASPTKAKITIENEELCISIVPSASSGKETISLTSVIPELAIVSPALTQKCAQSTMGLESSCSPSMVDKPSMADSDLNPHAPENSPEQTSLTKSTVTYDKISQTFSPSLSAPPESPPVTKRPRLASFVVAKESGLAPTYSQLASYTPVTVHYLNYPSASWSYGAYSSYAHSQSCANR